jgi:MerR family Zn(II)-responsive transcriptional regulator of zntA
MQIGRFARKAGVSVRAIRYYEELGLLNPDSHSDGGFRLYGSDNFKRLQVINFLKDLGLSLTEIRQILQAKKPSGGDKNTVEFLLGVFNEKLALVEEKLSGLNRIKSELTKAIKILHSCESCDHKVLLDAICCDNCTNLVPRDAVPDTFEVILQ